MTSSPMSLPNPGTYEFVAPAFRGDVMLGILVITVVLIAAIMLSKRKELAGTRSENWLLVLLGFVVATVVAVLGTGAHWVVAYSVAAAEQHSEWVSDVTTWAGEEFGVALAGSDLHHAQINGVDVTMGDRLVLIQITESLDGDLIVYADRQLLEPNSAK